MQATTLTLWLGAMGIGLALTGAAVAETAHDHSHDHDHTHDHSHADDQIAKGYFEDAQVQPRALSDWAGDWQSVYPLLTSSALDPVMADKAAHGDKSAEDYRAYYETGYQTDVNRIEIAGDKVTFHRGDAAVSGSYTAEAPEILTYEKGNRGVRYIFRKTEGDEGAPDFIQFSDHAIAPVKAGHYHLYFGDDRAGLLANVTNWPTYYPAALTADEVVHEMLAH